MKLRVIEKGQEFWYKGELICVATQDCFAGQPATPLDFRWIGCAEPQYGDPIHPAIIEAFKKGRERATS